MSELPGQYKRLSRWQTIGLWSAFGGVLAVCGVEAFSDDTTADDKGCQAAVEDTVWSMADTIARQEPAKPVDRVLFELRSVNPGVNLGDVDVAQEIIVPVDSYCDTLDEAGFSVVR